ncbi:MAG: dihydroorotate dehydrogenase [Planctomycetota bacterium]|nr:MAG: dihydroorotate dehydrogenase [Planctomycetota bacterium]
MGEQLLQVFAVATLTALATGLGALPLLLLPAIRPRAIGIGNALAAGLMLGASFGLVLEGSARGAWQVMAGAALGAALIAAGERWLRHRPVSFGALSGELARPAVLVVSIMTIHSAAEGVAIGVCFGGGPNLAALLSVAIAVHNVPEGLAISMVLRPRGASVLRCAVWSVVSSLPQPLLALPAFAFVEAFRAVLPYGLGFAAGAMVYLVFLELLPEAYEQAYPPAVGLLASLALAAMVVLQSWLG